VVKAGASYQENREGEEGGDEEDVKSSLPCELEMVMVEVWRVWAGWHVFFVPWVQGCVWCLLGGERHGCWWWRLWLFSTVVRGSEVETRWSYIERKREMREEERNERGREKWERKNGEQKVWWWDGAMRRESLDLREREREREMGRGVSEERSRGWASRALNSLLFEKDPHMRGKTVSIFSGLLLVGRGMKPRNSSSCVLTAQEACMLSELISASHVIRYGNIQRHFKIPISRTSGPLRLMWGIW
jgi:hypothetical protein